MSDRRASTADDLVQQAIDELYSVDPDEFTERRSALAAQARTTDKTVARDIAALRKPTRSAYALNRLVRSDPEVAARLAELGDDLRSAQESLDGARMRELSTLRRGMVEELADQAFQATGQPASAAGLREEVVSTLNAAVADDSVVAQLGSGTLLRPARWDGFGFASPPELSVVRPPSPRRSRDEPTTRPTTGAGKSDSHKGTGETITIKGNKAAKATKGERGAAEAAAQAEARAWARAEAKAEEQRRRQSLAAAQRAVKDTDSALGKAVQAEEDQQTRARLLHEQLTDARRRLDEIRIDLRRAENRQRKAQQALDRLQK